MKKLFLLSGLFLILFTLNSCNNDYYYNTMDTIIVTIYEKDWKLESTNTEEYYYYEMRINEITNSVLINGDVSVYLQTGRDSSPNLYPLPDVKTWDDGKFIYTETISFEILSPNTIAFKVERSDLSSVRPGTMKFKVVVTRPY